MLINVYAEVVAYCRDKMTTHKGAVTPSQLGKCLRAIVMKDRGYEELPLSDRQILVFEMGFLIEKFILDALEARGCLTGRQVKCEYKGICGVIDAILKDGRMMDVKSVHSKKFDFLKPDEVDETYGLQQTFYALAKDIKQYFLQYVSKDDMRMVQIPIDRDEWTPRVEQRLIDIDKALKDTELPPEKNPPTWNCFSVGKKGKTVKIWCPFIKHCPTVLEQFKEACRKFNISDEVKLI